MRFIADGPELPDELLTARDAGHVLFFCGAGVSQAQANLPNFPSLAGGVLSFLGSALDSPARRLFSASQNFEKVTGLTGGVATDRIFSLLEQEFYPEEVRQAVAKALVPPLGHGLEAHRILLDLSRDPAGVVRLVTTNFDRLFEEADPTIGSFNPPHLPDPRRSTDFRGIIHIHGRVDADYSRACDNEFVLSSADFGRAYLADGWATRYIQTLLQRFKIVFVGYSADDPPVQYLLEALSREGDRPNALYAFQSGTLDQAATQWRHKGVQPIPYDSANGHFALWETLRAWAYRARDVDAWHDRVIEMAAAGPSTLQPHERGIVAHLAATRDGARRLADKGTPLPAEWLCVFDPNRRYAPPGPRDHYVEGSERVDPFESLGLDSDQAPSPSDPDDRFSSRRAPADAWDLFSATEADCERLSPDATGSLRGANAGRSSKLPPRLWHLGAYLVRVAHQPAAVWWAAHQQGLHPDIVSHLEWTLRQDQERFPPAIRDAWRLLIAAWRTDQPDPDRQRYEIEAVVAQSGWSTTAVRSTINMYRPLLTVEPPILTRLPPAREEGTVGNVIRPDVTYPRPHQPLIIPQEHLGYALRLLRAQIEHAIILEKEIGGDDRLYFDTTRADDGELADENGFQLTGLLATFVNMMARLAEADRAMSKEEFDHWPAASNSVFDRLRIWAAGQPAILDPEDAAAVFLSLDDETFWNEQQERDLLYALRDRWTDLDAKSRQDLEQRLLTGSFPWPEPRDDLARIKAHYRLNRLQWLSSQGLEFGFDLEAEMSALRKDNPDWETRFADRTAQPNVGKVRRILTNTDATPLEGLSVGEVLATVREASGRDFETFIDHRPFSGLVAVRPAFALAVLTDAARKGEVPTREWAAFLHATATGELKRRLLAAIVARLAKLGPEKVAELRHPISEWMRDRATELLTNLPDVFQVVWALLVTALVMHPPKDRFRRADAGWVDDGLNQPAGRMVDALLKDPAKAAFNPAEGLSAEWKSRLDQLLALPGDARRHAIAMIAPHTNWLYFIDPDWTESRLLAVAEEENADAQAFWGGYFLAAQTPQLPLYIRLKPAFIALARRGGKRRDHSNKLAGMLLHGWGGSDEPAGDDALISDVELREVLIHGDDDLRTQMLWYLQRWSNEAGSKWGDRILPFLKDVWPRQRAVRTPQTMGRLVDMALAMPNRFAEIVDAILPVLDVIGGSSARISHFFDLEEQIASEHPRELLDLLWKVLPEDAWQWPYETRRTLDALKAQDLVRDDTRLAELTRREQSK